MTKYEELCKHFVDVQFKYEQLNTSLEARKDQLASILEAPKDRIEIEIKEDKNEYPMPAVLEIRFDTDSVQHSGKFKVTDKKIDIKIDLNGAFYYGRRKYSDLNKFAQALNKRLLKDNCPF